MIVSEVKPNNTFKALYMPQKRNIFGKANAFYANVINETKSDIEAMAQDCNIYVKLRRGKIKISVGQVITSAFKRALGLIGITVNLKVPLADHTSDNIASALIDTVRSAKEEFVTYHDYLFKS